MSAPDAEERDRRKAQRYRNLVAGLVIGGIVVALAALYVVLLPGVAGAASAACSIAFLAFAFIAWEYLMKPGYGRLHRRHEVEPGEGRPGEPPSPGAP